MRVISLVCVNDIHSERTAVQNEHLQAPLTQNERIWAGMINGRWRRFFTVFLASMKKAERWAPTWWNHQRGNEAGEREEILLLGIQGKSDYKAPGEDPCSFPLRLNINFALCLAGSVCLRASWGIAISVVPGQATCTLQESGLPRVLVPTEWESVQRALWLLFGSLSFASFPWTSCMGWRRPWCGVRWDLDATNPDQSDLFSNVLNGNWMVPYRNLHLYFLWAGNLQLADSQLTSGLQLSNGYLLTFQV